MKLEDILFFEKEIHDIKMNILRGIDDKRINILDKCINLYLSNDNINNVEKVAQDDLTSNNYYNNIKEDTENKPPSEKNCDDNSDIDISSDDDNNNNKHDSDIEYTEKLNMILKKSTLLRESIKNDKPIRIIE